MGREDEAGARHQAGLLERDLPAPAELTHALDGDQESMALVHVEDVGLHAQGSQRAHAADAQHDLLWQPAFGLRNVEPVGDGPQLRRVRGEVGVEKEERDAADLRAPHRDVHGRAADRRFDLDAFQLAHRELLAAVLGVHLDLPPRRIDVLAAEAVLVEKAHRHERKPEVARRLQVVAGQHAEAARVDRQALGDAELEREVPDEQRSVRVEERRIPVVVLAVRRARVFERAFHVIALARLGDAFLAELIEVLLGGLASEELPVLERAVRASYAGAGVSDDPATHARPAPLLTDLARHLEEKHGPAAGKVLDQADVQKALPADAALLGWVDMKSTPKAADPSGD